MKTRYLTHDEKDGGSGPAPEPPSFESDYSRQTPLLM